MGDISPSESQDHPNYTLYVGTFIQLPREADTPATSTSPPIYKLSVKEGALWVDTLNGRIAGSNWEVKNDDDLNKLAESMGWILTERHNKAGENGQPDEAGRKRKRGSRVNVVRARKDHNGFFFPGFIGKESYCFYFFLT